MSGVGKSTVVGRLTELGFTAVDTDDGWCDRQPDGRQLWRLDAVRELLTNSTASPLFVAGCEENMTALLPEFDLVVLLTAPLETLLERLDVRKSNRYGRSPLERSRFLEDVRQVEPLLRQIADDEVDTTLPLDEVVQTVLRLAGAPRPDLRER